jgi:hypothetical protein
MGSRGRHAHPFHHHQHVRVGSLNTPAGGISRPGSSRSWLAFRALIVAMFLLTLAASAHGKALAATDAMSDRSVVPSRERDLLADVSPPLTSISTSPMTPNGDSGWFKGASPIVTPTAVDREGSEPAVVLYGWGTSPPENIHASTHTAPIGENYLFYRAVDSVGNEEPLRSLQFKVDTGVPAPTVSEPIGSEADHAIVSGPVRFEAAAFDSVSGVSFVVFYYFREVGSGWAAVGTRIGLEQAPPSGSETATDIVYGVTWNTVLVPDGDYKLQVQVRDAAGNTSFSDPQFVRVDNWGEAPGGDADDAGDPAAG